MKKAILILTVTLVTSAVYAHFSLDNVKSISCEDSRPTRQTQVKLWTQGQGADKYLRSKETIPYAYGNQKNKMGSFQTGVFTVQARQTGFITLVEADTSTLILYPTAHPQKFLGQLSGGLDVRGKWIHIKNHPLICTVL